VRPDGEVGVRSQDRIYELIGARRD
jgi:hypothetical protein